MLKKAIVKEKLSENIAYILLVLTLEIHEDFLFLMKIQRKSCCFWPHQIVFFICKIGKSIIFTLYIV